MTENTCPLHDVVLAGLESRIKTNAESVATAFKEINAMKKWVVGLLTAIIVLLLTQLLVAWQSNNNSDHLADSIYKKVVRQLKSGSL